MGVNYVKTLIIQLWNLKFSGYALLLLTLGENDCLQLAFDCPELRILDDVTVGSQSHDQFVGSNYFPSIVSPHRIRNADLHYFLEFE